MDEAEAHIQRYLQHCGFKRIVHEPDGNVPPDFLVDGKIAIEVRRLIQHEDVTGAPRGLTETRIPRIERIEALLKSMGPPDGSTSWFVLVRFARPLEEWRRLEPRVKEWLEGFRSASQIAKTDRDFGGGFSMTVVAASKPLPELFCLGMVSDEDSGGWVLAELERSLRLCIEEKTRKVAPERSKYPEWWLVMSDHIGRGLSEHDREEFRATVRLVHNWDKIILVNPADHTDAFEV